MSMDFSPEKSASSTQLIFGEGKGGFLGRFETSQCKNFCFRIESWAICKLVYIKLCVPNIC